MVPVRFGLLSVPRDLFTEYVAEVVDPYFITSAGPLGIGLVTGAGSGVFALDIDPRHGGDDTLAALEVRFGRVVNTDVTAPARVEVESNEESTISDPAPD